MRRFLFVALLLGAAARGYSQGLEITERSDAIRPTLLSYVTPDSNAVQLKYLAIQGNVGYAIDYQYRDVFTKQNFLISRVAGSYYFRNFQVNGKIYGLKDLSTGENVFRTKLQFAFSVPDSEDISRFQLSWNTELKRRGSDTSSYSVIHEFVFDFTTTSFFDDKGTAGPDVESGYVVSYRPELRNLFYGFLAWLKVLETNHFARSLNLGAGYFRNNIRGNDRSAVFKTQAALALKIARDHGPLYLVGSYSVDYRDHYRKNWELGIIVGGDLVRSVTKSFSPLTPSATSYH